MSDETMVSVALHENVHDEQQHEEVEMMSTQDNAAPVVPVSGEISGRMRLLAVGMRRGLKVWAMDEQRHEKGGKWG